MKRNELYLSNNDKMQANKKKANNANKSRRIVVVEQKYQIIRANYFTV